MNDKIKVFRPQNTPHCAFLIQHTKFFFSSKFMNWPLRKNPITILIELTISYVKSYRCLYGVCHLASTSNGIAHNNILAEVPIVPLNRLSDLMKMKIKIKMNFRHRRFVFNGSCLSGDVYRTGLYRAEPCIVNVV